MRLRIVLVPVVVIAAAALVPGAAFAKVTKNPEQATHVIRCDDGSKRIARVWWNAWNDTEAHPTESAWKTWAVDNPCKRWLIINAPGDSESDPYGATLSIAPKTSFQTSRYWGSPDSDDALGIFLAEGPNTTCRWGYDLYQVGPKDHGRWRTIAICPSAPWA